jgi:hypothetical protein
MRMHLSVPDSVPEVLPRVPVEFPGPENDTSSEGSLCTLSSAGGTALTLWSLPSSRLTPDANIQVLLKLAPDAPIVIGRANGGNIEYLDPSYVPSPIMPGTGTTILQHGGAQIDLAVSRGHFMLRAHPLGVLLVNGVPKRGGGIRPPRNWTELLWPQRRLLQPAEEYVIERGQSATISLPNSTRVTLKAD